MTKEEKYASLIYSQLCAMFEEDSENFIDKNELLEDNNATAFVHAMATMAPNLMYVKLTGVEQDNLGFNHIANRLIVQFQNKED